MGRSPCCDKSKVKRGTWSPEEDATLKNYLHKHGTAGNWIALPHKAGLRRCGKSCRLRWLNYLRPDIKHGAFTQEEENIIYNLYNRIGSRWSVIASQLPGRTDNDVKNHWNTKLKKKLIPSYTNPPTKSNIETATAAATNTIADKATIFQELTNSSSLPENTTGPVNDQNPINPNFPRLILEGSSSDNQDLSNFQPFDFGMDEDYGVNNGISIDGHSCEVVSGIWSQEELGFGDESNADLFSIFQR